jgi:hypothetical protein
MQNRKDVRKKYFIVIAFIAFLFLGTGCSKHQTLVENGKSHFKIFVSDSAIPSEKNAAKGFQKTIKDISGCNLPIVNQIGPDSKYVFIGFNGAPPSLLKDLNISKFGKEEFILRTDDENLLIAGGQPRGTLYGVLDFLSENLGCRWYTPDFSKIPKQNTIAIKPLEKRQKPCFEYREAWYNEAYNAKWAVHNRLNPTIVSPPDSMGGGYNIYPFCHTFYRLVPPKTYFESHPEYFSEIDGKRKGHEAQLCLTNPDVVKIATETVFRWIKENPNTLVFAVDQNDGSGWCECPNCKALDDKEGSHSATTLNFVNQVADNVAEVYPDVTLLTFAYFYSEMPPKTIRPRSNVTVRLCHYNYCSAHSLEGCENHRPFIERLVAWDKISERIIIWDYFTDFSHYLVPFPNFEALKNDVRFYADHGVKGLFAQGNNVPENGGGEFSQLRAWVFAQLMWDPYQDAQALIDEFVENVYGPGAQYIKSYIKLLHDKVKPDSVYFSIYAKPTDGGYLTPEVVNEAEQLFVKAEKAAAKDAALLKRIELAHLPILYTRLYFYSNGGPVYLSEQEMPDVLNKFQRILKEHNITRIAENADRGNIQYFVNRVLAKGFFVPDWWIIGPFDNSDANGLQTVYPPETEFKKDKAYFGKNKKTIGWEYYQNKQSGYIDFTKIYKPSDNGVAYARRVITMPKDDVLKIGVGSNDGVRLWVNGKLELDNKIARKAEPNQDILNISLKKGENTILLKIDQLGGGWGFYFSVLDETYKKLILEND